MKYLMHMTQYMMEVVAKIASINQITIRISIPQEYLTLRNYRKILMKNMLMKKFMPTKIIQRMMGKLPTLYYWVVRVIVYQHNDYRKYFHFNVFMKQQ